MRIGVDIDDTTFVTVKSMLKFADKFEEETNGKPADMEAFGMIKNRKYLNEIYGWDDETKFKFFDKYYKDILEDCTMQPDADKILKKLQEEGDSIHFVTSRLTNIKNCETEEITKRSLAKFNIKYDSLNINVLDKLPFFKENNLELCIEDSYEVCKALTDNGIDALLMTTKMNKDIEAGNITRVSNWQEIYSEIEKIKAKKKNI